jgi:mannose-6-phosphate isomerase-like protein (cupin superfamily)
MDSNSQISFGDMSIRVVVSDALIESFDATLPRAGLGPGLHYHTNMDEIFYVQSGRVAITCGETEIVATAGMVVRVPKMTRHGWKSVDGPARLLFSFIPGGNQKMYLTELGELSRSGASWAEGIAVLQSKYDNKPL